jgi:hypothetical protein
MLGKALTIGPLVGITYLSLIMWWVTGHTPLDVIDAIADIINQPLQQVVETLK